jgi:hypothetical protein
MNLYIEIENGQPKNHPAFEDNLIEAFGSVPSNWEAFVRVEKPIPTTYQVLEAGDPTYSKVNDVWSDVWPLRDMTAQEKATKQQVVIDAFNSREQAENWSAWILNDATCKMIPPITRPEPDQTKLDAGIFTFWCGVDSNWRDTPARPVDDNQYKFDFLAWQWVQI